MYNHKEIEKKWQNYWEENNTFKCENDFLKPKYYCLDMFPYPSGAGLHVGHPIWPIANDIITRYKKANGFNVLHPIGWDAFWLPAENYAIKTGTHPRITTDENIANFKKQIKSIWYSYDWDREIDTTDPKYYKWTQWIFLKLFEKGLAYEQDLPINYCPSCKTGLANEEVLNDFTCERCGTKVEKKKIRQWVLGITKYADRLAKDVDKLDWPEGIKDMQRNWIGRSEGCEFEMKLAQPHPNPLLWEEKEQTAASFSPKGERIQEWGLAISVYTTRIDTVFGMTYAVLASDHPHVSDFITDENKDACEKYIDEASKKSDQDRTADNKEKTWVFTWSYLINPFNWRPVQLWIGDYVLWNYGTWAVMAVPAHDIRDHEFAKKYNLEIIPSISPKIQWNYSIEEAEEKLNEVDVLGKAFTEKGILINSWEFTWLTSKEAQTKMAEFAEENWFGKKTVNYKLRDWLFSRQRYWWEPIPLIHLKKEDMQKLPHITDMSQATDDTLAYILKRDPATDEFTENVTCGWKVRELIIWGKVFSKIYDGLYGKMICDYRLPLELPEVEEYAPAGDGQSPLAKVDDFVNVKLADNLSWKRETNTMPQWGWSCWYYLRYMDVNNPDELVNKDVVNYWGEVDSYVGWAEHAVLHLLYARFWHKFLFDIGVVPTDEPFYRLRNQGLILAHAFQRKNWGLLANDLVEEKDGKYFEIETWDEVDRIVSKMSKSLKNVINPDDIIAEYGADSLRLYEMYMAEFKDAAPWDTKWIIWVKRFLDKSERLFGHDPKISTEDDIFTDKLLHKTIKKVESDIENYKFNTAIAALIILINNWLPKAEEKQWEWKSVFVRLLQPFAPHLAEELNERLWNNVSLFNDTWPEYDEKMTIDDTMKIWVQVLGKLRWDIEVSKDEDKDSVLEKARNNEGVAKWIEWKTIVKEIYVPGRIVNIVVK